MELSIQCSKREEGKNPRAIRREGLLPAVLYGHNGTESVALTLNAKDAETLLRKASVKKTPIHLSVPDMPWEGKAVLQEVQAHPWKGSLYHISFFSVPE